MDKKYKGHRERIRQKYLQGGYSAFLEYEILELLLTYAIPRIRRSNNKMDKLLYL